MMMNSFPCMQEDHMCRKGLLGPFQFGDGGMRGEIIVNLWGRLIMVLCIVYGIQICIIILVPSFKMLSQLSCYVKDVMKVHLVDYLMIVFFTFLICVDGTGSKINQKQSIKNNVKPFLIRKVPTKLQTTTTMKKKKVAWQFQKKILKRRNHLHKIIPPTNEVLII